MKTIKDWVSCQLVTRSLLSTRPFRFFDEEPPGERNNNQGMTVMANLSEHASANSVSPPTGSNEVNVVPPHPQFITAEVSCPFHSNDTNCNCNSGDPLTKVEALQINFLRLVQRIGLSLDNPVVTQVLYRLQLACLIRAGESDIKRASLKVDSARAIAVEREASSETSLNFSFKILVLGKTGVGKSATINSIFNQKKTETDAFQPATNRIEEVTGTLKGIKITIIDTPGLSPSYTNQGRNRKILLAVKRFIRKSPPDIILYFERLDAINRGYSDFPLLKLITDYFGSSVWFNTILVMTHSSSAIPEGSDGYPVNYEAFGTLCTNLLQHYIKQAASDNQLETPSLLVENHPLCRTNMEGEKTLPNGVIWRHQFLLLCISSKILTDANKLLKFEDSMQIGQRGTRLPSLPHILSALLRPSSLTTSSGFDNEMDAYLDMDNDDDDYDNLPPICILTKAQFQRLTKDQKNDYLAELDYRETLYLKKQWKEDVKRRKESMLPKEPSESNDNDESDASPDSVPLPDMAIPLSFDSDYPVYRYRCVLTNDQFLVRPVLDSQGWDRDVGFDGINLETSMEVKKNFHGYIVGQMNKDKEEFNLQAECATKYLDPSGSSLSAGIEVQTAGSDMICTVRGDADFKNLNRNTTGCGLSLTSFRHMYLPGAKLEDSILIGKRFKLGLNMGCVSGCGQVAYGGGLEATVRGKDYPVRDDKTTLAMTLLSFDKEIVLGGNIQSDFRAGRRTKMSVNANLNSRKLGQISIKTGTSEHIGIALIAAISLARVLFRRRANDPPNS